MRGAARDVAPAASLGMQGATTSMTPGARLNSWQVVLFSTDVSARGVDYPDVTAVVQARAYAYPTRN